MGVLSHIFDFRNNRIHNFWPDVCLTFQEGGGGGTVTPLIVLKGSIHLGGGGQKLLFLRNY